MSTHVQSNMVTKRDISTACMSNNIRISKLYRVDEKAAAFVGLAMIVKIPVDKQQALAKKKSWTTSVTMSSEIHGRWSVVISNLCG